MGDVLIGRREERRAIDGLLAGTGSGRGGALVLRGEPGIGKSALLSHAARTAAGRHGMRVLSCAGVETEVEHAFSGLHQLLRPVLGGIGRLPGPQARALRGALGLADAEASDFLVAAAVLTLITEVAAERRLLVVVDDAQWLDRASAAALLFAARRLAAEPVAVLLAARTEAPGGLPELALGGLPPDDAARLLAAHGWDPSEGLRERVVAATGGHPLALVELAGRAESERRALAEDLALTGTVPIGTRLRTAFLRQVDALPAACRDLLLVAAAEETGDSGTVLGAAARLGVPGDALAAAERSGLVVPHGTELRFRHPLIRSAAYAEASSGRRRAAHLALAGQLAASGERDRAVWHRALAATAPDEELAAALESGADAARRRGGEAAAVSVLRRAARLSETGEGRRRRTVAAAFAALDSGRPDLARELAARVMAEPVPPVTLAQLTGTVELYSGDPAVACARLTRCAELMGGTDPEEAAWTLTLASGAAFQAGDLEGAVGACERIAALDCAPATHRAARGLAQASQGLLHPSELWELPAALSRSQPESGGRPWMWAAAIGWLGPDQHQARRLAEEAGRQLRAAGSAAALTELLYYRSDTEYRLGAWTEGVAHAEEGLRFTHGTGQRGWAACLLALLARFAAARGEAEECRGYAERALALALPLRQRAAAATAAWALGLLALGEGDAREACARFAEVEAPGSPTAHRYVASGMVTELVEAALRAGRPDLAAGPVARFEGWVRAFPTPWGTARLHHCRALLAEADGGEPERHYRAALAGGGLADRPFDQARTALHLGEWLRRGRRRADARPHLRAAAEAFDALGAVPWARRARSQLRATGGPAHRRGSSAGPLLSPQELAVARLAARGLSNREIGERLSLSPRTVGSHLYRMFPKLGVSTRSQLRDLDLGPDPE